MRWREMPVIALLVLAVVLCKCSRENTGEPTVSVVVGTVSDKESGSPIDSATVSPRVGPDTTDNLLSAEMTDIEGRYRLIAGYYGGDVYVLAEKDGFTSMMQDAYLRKHDTVVVNFELERR